MWHQCSLTSNKNQLRLCKNTYKNFQIYSLNQAAYYGIRVNIWLIQDAITLVQKKDAELCIIEGLHDHDPRHEVNNIYNKQNENQNNMWSFSACNG